MAAAAASSTFLAASSAQAATEVAQIAGGDNRAAILLTLLAPAVGWVAFNILGGLQGQLERMSEIKDEAGRAVIGGAGLSAAGLLLADNAQAASEVAQIAGGDNRAAIILTLLLPAVGWVAFNIFQALQGQIERMSDMKDDNSKGIAGAVGLGAASLLFADSAQAASEVAQVAGGDNRAVILLTLLLPAVGWVAFNIFQGLQGQIERMSDMKDDANRGVAGAVGLTAVSMLFAESASASMEMAQIAGGDNRAVILLSLLAPAVGWVGFNIFSALQGQIERMGEMKDE